MIFFRKLFWKKAQKKVLARLVNAMASQDNYDISNTILIIGSARSGTTFVMESINHENEYRVIFEPFVSEYTNEWEGYKSRAYIDPENIAEKEKDTLAKILSGKISNPWVDGHNMKMKSSKRIVKAIRANLFLPAIRKLYPSLPIVYITRDIKEVVESRLKMGFDDELEVVLSHHGFLSTNYPSLDMKSILSSIKTAAGRHALMWLLENKFLVENKKSLNLHHVNYDDIKEKSIRYIGGKFIITDEESRPSASTSNVKPYSLSKEEIDDIDSLTRLFKNDSYSPESKP